MKVFGSLIPVLLAMMAVAVSADKRPRVTFFQRQTQSSSTPAPSTDKKPSGADSGPYPPSNSAPYPPSGWKPDGPQLEYGTPDKKPSPSPSPSEGASAPTANGADSATATATLPPRGASPTKLLSLLQPESNVYYYVLDQGRLQPVIATPVSASFLQQKGSAQRLVLTKSVQVSVPVPVSVPVSVPVREIELVQAGPIYASSGSLVRILRNA